MAGVTYQVFFDDPTGTPQIDNWPNALNFVVDTDGNLIIYSETTGLVAAYSSAHWKRIKVA